MVFKSNKPEMEISQEYLYWRKTIFSIPFDRDDPTPDMSQIESVIMDMGLPAQDTSSPLAISMKVFNPKIAAYYRTSGDNVPYVDKQPQIAQATSRIIHDARELRAHTKPTRDFSLPEPGIVQFFFVTRSGVSVFASPLQEVQQSGHLFHPMLDQFNVIRQIAEQNLEEKHTLEAYTSRIKKLYVMVFTPEAVDQDSLKAITQESVNKLKGKNLAFKQRFEGKSPEIQLEMINIKFVPTTHTPKYMQTLMSDWLSQQYNVPFNPKEDENYFFHGMRNAQGRQNIFLFYFDFE